MLLIYLYSLLAHWREMTRAAECVREQQWDQAWWSMVVGLRMV